ncbi:MAG: REP-associated tyrosine transposase, partial [Hyphomicrobiaceae bacterium]
EPGATYFFTLVTFQRRHLFSNDTNVDRWHRAVEAVRQKRAFTVEAEVILPDHIHLMWTLPPNDADYATRIRLAKTRFTKSLPRRETTTVASRAAKRESNVWQRRYWEHTIRNESDFITHLDYIHFNPVHHGLVTHALDWQWSSLRCWIGRGVYDQRWGSQDMMQTPEGSGPD